MKLTVLFINILFFASQLSALEDFVWHEKILPDSNIEVKACQNNQLLAIKLMWQNKILIYEI